ncbi:MAG: aminotransferase class III-fold pyridoxal phosphate-dependent enzyme, partial [Alphaproteobacteria bacterium]|nr:aminotransferase class III-fold pyridoxal phosphate-dependent enzyme [Alphaproteobacteria bacterium]
MTQKSKTSKTKIKPATAAAEAPRTPLTVVPDLPIEQQSNAALLRRRTQAVPRGVASATPIFASYAENAELWDVEGNRFIDFVGGIAVLNTGHRHPRVVAAAKAHLTHAIGVGGQAAGQLLGLRRLR